jgi:hypothetical protein
MTGPAASAVHDSPANSPVDFSALISSLRLAGAAQFDPVRLHYLHVLAQRAVNQPAPVKRLLEAKLKQALAGFQERFERAQGQTQATIGLAVLNHPDAAMDLQRLFQTSDFKAVRQHIEALNCRADRPSLGALTRHMARRSASNTSAGLHGAAGLGAELQTTQFFRDTWSKLSVGKRVIQELAQAPKNAGPINSHSLVLRSLATLHTLSPDYLSRFTSYVDTLLSLDQRDKVKQVVPMRSVDGDVVKKTKSRRAKKP